MKVNNKLMDGQRVIQYPQVATGDKQPKMPMKSNIVITTLWEKYKQKYRLDFTCNFPQICLMAIAKN